MLEQVQGLTLAIEDYKTVASGGELGGKNIHDVIGVAITGVWNILGKNHISASGIVDAIMLENPISDDEYRARVGVLLRAFEEKHMGQFSAELLALFGVENPTMFISRGKISGVTRPILSTKIKASVLLKDAREKARKIPKKGPDLEGLPATLSMYEASYSSLLDRKSGIHHIVYDELIPTLADEGEFKPIKKYTKSLGLYKKKEEKEEELISIKERIIKLERLTKNGTTQGPKKKLLSRKLATSRTRLVTLEKEHKEIMESIVGGNSINLAEVVPDIGKAFGVTQHPRKKSLRFSDEIIPVTSGKIHGRIKRAMAVVIHKKFPEMRKLRANEGAIKKMIKRYEQTIRNYQAMLEKEEDLEKKGIIINSLREELDIWEAVSSELLGESSIRQVRLLRDTIIEELTTEL